jgi:hypothetical protein
MQLNNEDLKQELEEERDKIKMAQNIYLEAKAIKEKLEEGLRKAGA